MPARSRLAKHGTVGSKGHSSPGDHNDGQLRGVRRCELMEKHTRNDGAGYTQTELYCDIDAGAVEEPVSKGPNGNAEQDEDDDRHETTSGVAASVRTLCTRALGSGGAGRSARVRTLQYVL